MSSLTSLHRWIFSVFNISTFSDTLLAFRQKCKIKRF